MSACATVVLPGFAGTLPHTKWSRKDRAPVLLIYYKLIINGFP